MKDFKTELVFAEYDFYMGKRELAFGKFFQLLLGFTHHENMWLTWGDIFNIDSDQNGILRDTIDTVRGYKIPVPEFLKFYLQKALDDNPDFPWNMVFQVHNPVEDLSIVYGLRILHVNGYSDDTIKDLKTHFKIKQNSDLLNFLGFSEKAEVEFNLSHINLDFTFNIIAKFPDKNFRQDYHFQKWTFFVRSLLSKIDYMMQPQTRIRIMLLLSLYTGVRLSEFLQLEWKDIFKIDTENKFIYIKDDIEFNDNKISIPDKLYSIICATFAISLIIRSRDSEPEIIVDSSGKLYEDFETGHFGFDCEQCPKTVLAEPVFITSGGSALRPNNLSREISNSLSDMGIAAKDSLKANSTQIMWGRRIIEIRGDHKATIKALMKHFKRKSKRELAEFLYLVSESGEIEFEGQKRKNFAEEMTYDILPSNPFGKGDEEID